MPSILLKEITNKRTYNQKVYDNVLRGGKGSNLYHISLDHVHYKKGNSFEDVNTALVFDTTTKTYKQSKASYHCSIPKYSDEWFVFYNAYKGTNHTIKAKPLCNHIQGVKINDQNNELGRERIVYEHAFGPYIDLLVNAYWAGVKKTIRIREKPAVVKDLHFEFELSLPAGAKVINKNNTSWVPTVGKLLFTDTTIRIGNNDKYSFFKNARVWDSGERGIRQAVPIQLYFKNGKVYLRKTITKELLEKAVYPLYTDHPTNYGVGAGDGNVHKGTEAVWANARDAAVGDDKDDTATTSPIGNSQAYLGYDIYRGFFPVDTSGITVTDNITAAVFHFNVASSNFLSTMHIVQTNQASTAGLVVEDYNKVTFASGGVKAVQYGGDKFITLDATGRTWIDKSGVSKLGMIEDGDLTDVGPPIYQYRYPNVNMSEHTTPGNRPYFAITTTPGVTPYPVALLKKGFISAYHCFMSAYIRAKVTGLTPLKLPDGTTF